MTSVVRLITFDITGTLLKFRSPVWNQYSAIAARHGINADPEHLKINFKSAWKRLNTSYPNFGSRGIGWQQWWKNLVVQTFEGTTNNQENLDNIADTLIKHFETSEAYSTVDGGEKVLASLRDQGFKLGVISNSDPRLHALLYNLNLSQYFSFILTSYEFGVEKPDARIFQQALCLANIKDPQEVLHIGDNCLLDFEGAKKAGLRSLLISHDENVGNEVLTDIRQINDYLHKL